MRLIGYFQRLYWFFLKLVFSPLDLARKQGVHFGENCLVNDGVNFGSEPYLISIGDNFYSSRNVQFITHDGSINVLRRLYKKYEAADLFANIKVGNNVFLGFGVTILPGSIIEDNVIVGAASLVKGRLQSNSVYAGSPARRICSLDEYLEKNESAFVYTKKMPLAKKTKIIKSMFNV